MESHKDQFLALYYIHNTLHHLVVSSEVMVFEFHFYADDSQLYLAFQSTTEETLGALVQIETCVKEIEQWMVKNKLKLNGDKTELLQINAQTRLCPDIKYIELSNSRVQPCKYFNT